MIRTIALFAFAVLIVTCPTQAGTPAEELIKKPDEWFRSDEGRQTMDTILSWQSDHGDWPKNKNTTKEKYAGDRAKLKGTFDNGATLGELRTLAHAFRVTAEERFKIATLLGFDHVLAAQYPNGGWPQYFPLSKQYHRHITFNDGSMIRILEFLRDSLVSTDFEWLDAERRLKTQSAIKKGIDCIVKCQVVIDGKPTVWCAQHDEITLAPTNARSYELASLSGGESAGILHYLMSLESPSPEVILAVKNGIHWYESAKIIGYRYQKSKSEPSLIADPSARPLWARFYELKTNKPFFCDRDGVVQYDIEAIGTERRSGYTWYGNWGESVLSRYAKWPHR